MNNSDSEPSWGPERYALPAGTRVQEFEILTVIGGGGFGIVYLAHDHSLQRRVALKEYMPPAAARTGGTTEVYVPSQRDSDSFGAGLRSFVNESRLLARFEHPALVKVHRFWEENGTAYMVMPYYEGHTLQKAVAEKRVPADEASLRRLLDPLMDALGVLHREQCYHRDVAPDNILLTSQGPVLLDFGAARIAIGEAARNFTVILKEGYAPVEQYVTDDATAMPQGPWTDIYALACVIRFVITGKKPVSAVTRMTAITDPMEPLASVLPVGVYSEPFLQTLDRAMSIHGEHRPQTIEQFRALLSTLPSTLESATLVRPLPAHLAAMRPVITAPFVREPAPRPQPPPPPRPMQDVPPPAPPAPTVPVTPRAIPAIPDIPARPAIPQSSGPQPRPAQPTARIPPPLDDERSRGSLKPWVVLLVLPLVAAAAYHYYPYYPGAQDWLKSLDWVKSLSEQPQPLPLRPPEPAQPTPPPATRPRHGGHGPAAPSSSSPASAPGISAASSSSESSSTGAAEPRTHAQAPQGKKSSTNIDDPAAQEANRPWNPALLLMIKAARTGTWRAVESQAAAIARVAKPQPEGNRQDSRELNEAGRVAVRLHNFPKALAAFEKAMAQDPSDLEIANNYGYALFLAGRKTDAQDVLTGVLLRDPAREVAWIALVEARGEDSAESLAAMKIALHFAASRERTLNNFRDMAGNHPDSKVRSLVKIVLEQSDLVPTVPEGQH